MTHAELLTGVFLQSVALCTAELHDLGTYLGVRPGRNRPGTRLNILRVLVCESCDRAYEVSVHNRPGARPRIERSYGYSQALKWRHS